MCHDDTVHGMDQLVEVEDDANCGSHSVQTGFGANIPIITQPKRATQGIVI